jgi:TP901 family phage tail tape measure protein
MAKGGNTSTAHIIITMEGKQAINFMSSLKAKANEVKKELDNMESMGYNSGNSEKYKELESELNGLNRAIKQNKAAYIDFNEIMNNLSGTSLKRLDQALRETRKQMMALDPEQVTAAGKKRFNSVAEYRQELARLQKQYTAIDNQIGKVTGSWKRQDGAIMSVIKRLSAYVGAYGVFNMITGKLKSIIKSNLEFSDSLTDIRKTTKLSTASVNQLSDAINRIDSRRSVQEMHNLAFEAGRLGIGRLGVEGVLGFVIAADKLGVALKEHLGDDAIVTLTKLSDVMGLTSKLGVEKSLLSIGSAINELAQNSTATGQFITDYTQRLAGIATQAHITIAELMGLAAATETTGQEVEVSATAMNKFIVQLQTHYKTVAKAAQVDENTLHNMLTMGQTMDAVIMVLDALSKRGGLSMLAPLMKDLGSDGARLTASLSTLASNVDAVREQVDRSREAFEQNVSVTNEYNLKNETAAAIMARMQNIWSKMFINHDNVDVAKELAQQLYDLSKYLSQNTTFVVTLRIAFWSLFQIVKLLIQMIPSLILLFSIKGLITFASAIRTSLIPAISMAITQFKALGTAADTSRAKTVAFGKAFKALNAVLKKNVFYLALSLIWVMGDRVVSMIGNIAAKRKELSLAEKDLKSFNEGLKGFGVNSEKAKIEVDGLFSRLKAAGNGTQERANLINQINKAYGSYLPNLLSEKSSLEEIATAQETVNKKLRQSLALKARNKAIDSAGQSFMPKMAEANQRIQEIYTAGGFEATGRADVQFLNNETRNLYSKGYDYDQILQSIWTGLSAKTFKAGGKEYKGRSYNVLRNIKRDKELKALMGDYIRNYIDNEMAIKRAEDAYNPIIGDYREPEDNPPPYQIQQQVKPAEKNKAERAELKWARDEYKGVIAAIEVYYKQEEQAINDSYLNQKITITEREQELAALEQRQLKTRIAARAALHDDKGAFEAWSDELRDLETEQLSISEAADESLLNLKKKNLKRIGDNLRRFGSSEEDGIWKNLETDKAKMQENMINLQGEIEEIITRYDYTAKVTDKFTAALQKLDLFFPEMKDRINGGMKDVSDAAQEAMAQLYSLYPKLFDINIDTRGGVETFRKMLSSMDALSRQYATLNSSRMKVLYYELLDYGDAMIEAEKKAKERKTTITDEKYKRTSQYSGGENDVNTKSKTVDVYKQAQAIGLATDRDVKDAEVALYEARLKAAMEYYTYLQSVGADTTEAQLDLQERINDLAGALVEKTVQQFEVLRNYGSNLESFGTEFGNAVFGDLDERQKALQNFVKQIGETTNKIIINWVKQKVEHALLRAAMVKTEEETQEQMSDADEQGSNKMRKIENTASKSLLKEAQKLLKSRLKLKKKSTKEEVQQTEEGQTAETTIVEAGQEMMGKAVEQVGQKIVTSKQTTAQANVQTSAAETQADVSMGIASGAAKTLGQLGWWGIPLVAVVTALLNGLLSMALSKVSGLFGGNNSADNSSTKLVTGMLTYDSGNVQSVLGSDGNSYSAQVGGISGSGLVTSPTLTNVGGTAALVGEKGPELVIGRKTTRALMHDDSGLLQALVSFDKFQSGRGFRMYDNGNLSNIASGKSGQSEVDTTVETVMASLEPTLKSITEALNQNAVNAQILCDRLNQPIMAKINKYGKGGLVDEVADGLLTTKRYNRSETVSKLFSN